MVAVAENTQMKQWRSVSSDWAASNPIPGDGEFVWSSDTKVLKIGDGVTTYNALPKLYDATLSSGDLTSAVTAAGASALAADTSAQNANQSNANTIGYAQTASDASLAALANQQLARDYAVGPPGTVLPTGGDSAAVSASKASDIALETRNIRMPTADVTASKTLASGDLFREHDCTNTGAITLTVGAGLFTSIDRKKGWAVFRQRGIGGSIAVAAATAGTDLVPPSLLKSGMFGYRTATIPGTGNPLPAAVTTLGNLPGVTNGRLVVIMCGQWNTQPGNTLTVTSDLGLTWTARRAQPDPAAPNLVPSWSVWDAPLITFAGGDVVLTVDPSTLGHYIGGFWFVLEGTVSGAPAIAVPTAFSVASFCSATLPALAASSQVLAVSAQRGSVTATAFTSFTPNIARIGSNNTAGANELGVSDFNNFKNQSFGRGSGISTITGDFTATANYSAAYDQPTIILVAYGPKTVAGAGTVNLELEGGRSTMTVQHGEMMLKFLPDGVTVQVLTSH